MSTANAGAVEYDPAGEFEDPLKDVAWAAYWEAYRSKCGVPKKTHVRAARHQFERWWERNAT